MGLGPFNLAHVIIHIKTTDGTLSSRACQTLWLNISEAMGCISLDIVAMQEKCLKSNRTQYFMEITLTHGVHFGSTIGKVHLQEAVDRGWV